MSDEPGSAESTPILVIDQSQLRVSGVTVEVGDDGSTKLGVPTVEIRADIWQHWLLVAAEQGERARLARQANPGREDSAGFVAAMQGELRASITAIAAAGAALEAFRDTVVQIAPSTAADASSTAKRVAGTLLQAFRFSNGAATAIRTDIRQVFDVRNAAIHPSSAFAPPAMHPVWNVGVERKYVNFQLENAVACAGIARSIIGACIASPRAKFPDLIEWCEGAAVLLLHADRAHPE